MARRARKKVTSRFRATDLFSTRVVITVTRSGVIILTTAIVIGIKLAGVSGVIAIVGLICAVVAVATTVEARFQLRTLRHEVDERVNSLIAAYQIPDEDLRELPSLGLLEEPPDNAPRIRLRSTK